MNPTNYPKSADLMERASRLLVGGVNSPVRSFKRVGGKPLFASHGKGAWLWDADNNKYIDFVMSYGPHLFGHARPEITQAVAKAMEGSACLGMSSAAELEWAELLLKRLKGAERVRALSTGTEATATAIRLARGVTGRDLVLKFAGHYHGHVDSLLVDAGSGVATLSQEAVPECAGVPKQLANLARVMEFNDTEGLRALFAREGDKLAALILEPIMGNMGVVPPDAEFLRECRALCTKHGALLIFDEVMTGLRVHRGSAQALYDVRPDLTCLGKIVGGGLPLSALAGSAKYMEQLAPLGPVYQAGTLSGNPVSIAAGIAMLKLIDAQDPYATLDATAAQLQRLFQEAALNAKIPLRVERVGSMLSCHFRKEPVRNAADTRATDGEMFKKYFWAMLEEGFMLPPSPFEAYFVSVPHAEIPVAEYKLRLGRVFERLQS